MKSTNRTGLFCAWRTAATRAAGFCGTRRPWTRCQWDTFEGGGYGNVRALASGPLPPSLTVRSVPASLSLCLRPTSRGACTEPLDHWVRPGSVCRTRWQLQIPRPLGLGTGRRGPPIPSITHHSPSDLPGPLPATWHLPLLFPSLRWHPSQGLGSAL